MATRRTHNVQTPGAAPSEEKPAEGQQPDVTTDTGQSADTQPAQPAAPTQPEPNPETEAQAEEGANPEPANPGPAPARTKKSAGPVNHREMMSRDIDASKLSAPVLCKDGWLVPDPKKGA